MSALILATALGASPAGASSLDSAIQAFVTEHGPGALLERDDDGLGVEFAGLFTSAPLPGEPDLAALAFLERWQDLWGYDPQEILEVEDVASISTLTFVTFAEVHEGIPVEWAGVKVTLDPLGRVRQVASRVSFSREFASPDPALSPGDAYDVVARILPELVPTGQDRLAYLPGGSGTAPLVWIVRTHDRSSPGAPAIYVDAHSGEILLARDTNVYADGNVYDPNPVADPTVYRRELLNLASSTNLDGTYARSFSCTAPGGGWDTCPGRVRHAAPDGSGHYLFDPTEPSMTDPFSEVMGYYHMDRINAHMETAYGHRFTCGGHRWMDVTVNMDYGNAWMGDQDDDGCADVTIGQDAYDYAYDSAIIYHEYGHTVNHEYSDLGWAFDGLGPDFSPSGVDEAFSDYWAATLIGRSFVGEYASLGTPGELGWRDLSEHAVCPDDMYGEGHYDSPMLSSALWDIREAIGMDKADRLALAVLGSISDTPDFDEAGRALLSQASALQSTGVLSTADVAVVDAAVADHTLVGCERIVTLEHGDTHLFFAQGFGGFDVPSSVQFMMYAPPGATRLTAEITQYTVGGEYTVYVNKGSPVHFTLEGWTLTIDDYDYMFDGSPDFVTFSEWSDPPIEWDTEYYYTYLHNSEFMALYVNAIIIAFPPPDDEPDASVDVVEDTVPDVPADTTGDTEEDVPSDVTPDPGSIKEDRGCGCSLAS